MDGSIDLLPVAPHGAEALDLAVISGAFHASGKGDGPLHGLDDLRHAHLIGRPVKGVAARGAAMGPNKGFARQGVQQLGHGGQRDAGVGRDLRRRMHVIGITGHLGHDDDGVVGKPIEPKHQRLQFRLIWYGFN
jgi:hypothetical protein